MRGAGYFSEPQRPVVDSGSRHQAPCKCRQVHERFERRAYLPIGLQSAIVLTVSVVAAPNQSVNSPGAIINGNQGTLKIGCLLLFRSRLVRKFRFFRMTVSLSL